MTPTQVYKWQLAEPFVLPTDLRLPTNTTAGDPANMGTATKAAEKLLPNIN